MVIILGKLGLHLRECQSFPLRNIYFLQQIHCLRSDPCPRQNGFCRLPRPLQRTGKNRIYTQPSQSLLHRLRLFNALGGELRTIRATLNPFFHIEGAFAMPQQNHAYRHTGIPINQP